MDALRTHIALYIEEMGEPGSLVDLVDGYNTALSRAYNELAPLESKSYY